MSVYLLINLYVSHLVNLYVHHNVGHLVNLHVHHPHKLCKVLFCCVKAGRLWFQYSQEEEELASKVGLELKNMKRFAAW